MKNRIIKLLSLTLMLLFISSTITFAGVSDSAGYTEGGVGVYKAIGTCQTI